MKNRTITVTVAADRDAVFAYLKAAENLSHWLPGFCSGLRRDGTWWRGTLLGVDAYFAVLADERTGVIDLLFGDQPDELRLLPLRVVRQPHGAAIIATLFQTPDWADEVYDLVYETLLVAMRGLTSRFAGGRVDGAAVNGIPFYPALVTARFHETWDFYTTQLGFRTVMESDLYLRLAHASGAQMGVLRHELDGPTPELVSATNGHGFWLNLDVADADVEYARLATAGVEMAAPLEDKPGGERQFVVRDPNGVLIAIGHRTEVRPRESRPLAVS